MVISTSACTAVDIDFGKVRLGAFARHWRPPPMPARSASAPLAPTLAARSADTHRDSARGRFIERQNQGTAQRCPVRPGFTVGNQGRKESV